MRIAGKLKCGFYPLPLSEAETIKAVWSFPWAGSQLWTLALGTEWPLRGSLRARSRAATASNLDAYRAEQARSLADSVIQGSCFDVHCPVDTVSLLYLNPPYDFESDEGSSQRTERTFLQHTYRWLKPGGVLVLVIPKTQDC